MPDYHLEQRSKNPQRLINNLNRWQQTNHIPFSRFVNDLRGYRLIIPHLREHEPDLTTHLLPQLKQAQQIYRFYVKDKPAYHAVHIYIQPHNHDIPWELQLWNPIDTQTNLTDHANYEQITKE